MTHYIAYLCLGSNLGDRRAYLERALERLQQRVDIISVSSVYETEPVELTSTQWFYNIAVKTETDLQPNELLQFIKSIEQELGRSIDSHLKSREIDIDILMYENLTYNDETVQVPHPKLTKRKFALTVLNDIAADVQHPVLQKTISELLKDCRDTSAVITTTLKITIAEGIVCENQ